MSHIRWHEHIILGASLTTFFSFFFAEWWRTLSAAAQLLQPDTPSFLLLCLLLLAGALIVQIVAAFMHINRPTQTTTYGLLGSALLIVAGCLAAVFTFGARGVGSWLALGSQVVLLGTVWRLAPEFVPRLLPSREDGLQRLLTVWSSHVRRAQDEGKQFALLSVHTIRPLTYTERETLRLHLRLHDDFLAVRDGLWVLIWDTDYHGALRAAEHIQALLHSMFALSSRIGVGLYPTDGESLAAVAMAADQAVLQTYEEGAAPIAAATPPGVNDAALFLRRRWAPILVEALQANVPVSVLAVRTSRRLSSHEMEMLKRELRARDEVFVVRDGLFILLWRTSREGAHFVANKVRTILAAHRIESWVGGVPETFIPTRLADELLQAWHLAETADDETPIRIAEVAMFE